MKFHLLDNPKAGRGTDRNRVSELVEDLRIAGHEISNVPNGSRRDAVAWLAEFGAASRGSDERLLVAGGDGLVNMAIQAIAASDVTIAVAPSGTGNDFAMALGIESATVESVVAPAANVDLMRLRFGTETGQTHDGTNEIWAASVAIAGFPARVNQRANSLPSWIGSAVYTVAAAIELPRLSRQHIELSVDDERATSDTAMLAIGNTRFFGGGMLACPDAKHDDHLLHVTSIEGVGRLGLLRHLLARTGGTHDRPEVMRSAGSTVSIDTPGIDIWADGEPMGTSPVTIDVVPAALSVAGVD